MPAGRVPMAELEALGARSERVDHRHVAPRARDRHERDGLLERLGKRSRLEEVSAVKGESGEAVERLLGEGRRRRTAHPHRVVPVPAQVVERLDECASVGVPFELYVSCVMLDAE